MAGIRAEEVNRPREVRAYGSTPGIGGADAIVSDVRFASKWIAGDKPASWS
jgi:hypothetical protein